MNIATCQAYFQKINKELFNNKLDFQNIVFELSKDDGIFLTLKNGKYILGIGKAVTREHANRVLTVLHMDITLGVKTEEERLQHGYSEFSTSVAKQKYKFFKPEYIWFEKDGQLIRDQIVEELKTNCVLKKNGKVDKRSIYGLFPKEYKFSQKSTATEDTKSSSSSSSSSDDD